MTISTRALLIIAFFGATAAIASEQSGKEFQSTGGLVRITSAPASTGDDGEAAGSDSAQTPARAMFLDTLTEIASLPSVDDRFDPLLEVYFLDHETGSELRFPAKLSQFCDFLKLHASEYTGGTPDSRSVAVVRGLSRELSVQMRMPGSEGSK